MEDTITIHLEKPNTLSELLPEKDRKNVVSLKITGQLGRHDFYDVLNEMCRVWSDFEDENDEEGTPDYENAAPLQHLDMGEATYVDGETLPHFGYQAQLETLILPKGIKTTAGKHDDAGFANSEKLKTLVLPAGLETAKGISNCPNLTEMTLPDSLQEISSFAFSGCTSLTSIRIPAKVKKMDGSSFAGCKIKAFEVAEKNPYFTVVDGVIYSKDLSTLVAFPSAYPHKHFTVPASTKVIGFGAFVDSRIKSIQLPDGVVRIEGWAFHSSKIHSIEIPDSVTSVGDLTFRHCTELEHIKLSSQLEEIPMQMISACKKLKTLDVPSSVKRIHETSLVWCESLEHITFHEGLEEIVNEYWLEVRKGDLKEVIFPSTLRYLQGGLFRKCLDVKEFIVAKENPNLCAMDGAIYSKDGKKLIAVPNAWREEFVVREGTEEIGDFALAEFSKMKKVVFPQSLKKIGHRALDGCTALKEIHLPRYLRTIEYRAFDNCTSLRKIIVDATTPPIILHVDRMWKLDYACCSNFTVYVPQGSLNRYKEADGWYYLNIKEMKNDGK